MRMSLRISMVKVLWHIFFKPATTPQTTSAATTSNGSVTPSTTTAKPSTYPLPVPTERLFVCVLGDNVIVVQDGFCDVLLLVYKSRFPFGGSARLPVIEDFRKTNPGSCVITKCGIDMTVLQSAHPSPTKLKSANGTRDLAWFEGNNFRHYAKLDLEIQSGNNGTVTSYIDYFKALREEQNKMNLKGVHIIGVSPLISSKSDTLDDDMRSQLRRYVTEIRPYALLIRTTQLEKIPIFNFKCHLNGPSLWTHLENVKHQVSFVQSLDFVNTVQLPSDLRILLSFSCGGYKTYYKSLHQYDPNNPDIDSLRREECTRSFLAAKSVRWDSRTCHRPMLLETDSMTNYILTRTLRNDFVDMFDTNVTYKMKICNAQKIYNFRGGYVLFDFDQIDTGNKCGDTNFTQGYADAHYIKTYMKTSFTHC
ncbi:uncharacterized protein LOC135394850 [Ornithodoros turicata]|uniref:uncharacterized protein LOC135394850 n=1 Tax=Ornithodoros turicata TaxID=34597 RepID=UPI0031388A56